MSYDDNSDLPGPSRGYGQRRERVVSSINVAPSNFVRKQVSTVMLQYHSKLINSCFELTNNKIVSE